MQAGRARTCRLDATEVAPKLYQGSLPQTGFDVRDCGFDVLVLAAEEWQPHPNAYPGVEVIHVPLVDAGKPLSESAWYHAVETGKRVARRLRQDKRVLTTCYAGLNRSGIVNVLAMYDMTGAPGKKLVDVVQRMRPGALSNPHFVEVARRRLPGR
jgi:protein-tyrosine phosphatase